MKQIFYIPLFLVILSIKAMEDVTPIQTKKQAINQLVKLVQAQKRLFGNVELDPIDFFACELAHEKKFNELRRKSIELLAAKSGKKVTS
jgi:hypothetical protein